MCLKDWCRAYLFQSYLLMSNLRMHLCTIPARQTVARICEVLLGRVERRRVGKHLFAPPGVFAGVQYPPFSRAIKYQHGMLIEYPQELFIPRSYKAFQSGEGGKIYDRCMSVGGWRGRLKHGQREEAEGLE